MQERRGPFGRAFESGGAGSGVIVDADNCPPLIKGSLLRVLHEHYCVPGVPRNLPPKKFVKRAKSLESKHR